MTTPTARYRAFVASTTTGEIVLDDVPITGNPSWNFAINSIGALTLNIPLGVVEPGDLESYTTPWRWSWGLAYGDTILQCGPVISESYNDGSDSTRISCIGLLGLFKKRLLIDSDWDFWMGIGSDVGDINISTPSAYGDMMARFFIEDQLRSGHTLPIQIGGGGIGFHEETFYGYDMATVAERVLQLSQRLDADEIEIRPRYQTGSRQNIFWDIRIGRPRLGNLDFRYSLDYPQSIVSIDYERDGSAQTTAHYEKGSGTERFTLAALSEDTTLTEIESWPWPVLETIGTQHVDVTDIDTLYEWSSAYLASNSRPIVTWSLVIRMDGTDGQGRSTRAPSIADIEVGDNILCNVRGHRRIPDGYYPQRIIGISNHSNPQLAKLILQPTQE